MRILLVCENIPAPALGGLAKHVVALGNALIDAGHQVTLMGRDGVDYAAHADEAGFRGSFIGGCGDPTRGWKERQLGFWNPFKREHFARRIARAIVRRAGDFDVVHYHGHLPMLARWIPPGLRFVQTRHDQGSDCMTMTRFRDGAVCRELSPRACAGCIHPRPGPVRTALSAWGVQRMRRLHGEAFERHPVVFVSEFLRANAQRTLPQAGGPQAQVVHNFVDERQVQRAAPPPTGVRVHVAGRIDAAKGIAEFLDLLVPRLPEGWSIDVFGEGPLRAQLERRQGGARVRFHGHRPQGEVQQSVASASVCVVPSLWEEPCGTVILESLRSGVPCFALARGGTPELARYAASGQLVLAPNMEALVQQLLTHGGQGLRYTGGESADVHLRLPELLRIYEGTSEGSTIQGVPA